MKIAVLMPPTIEDAGEFLADVRALEAAGAVMVGVAGDAPEQWVMLAAIAAVTQRIRIRVTGNEPEILRRLSRGRAVEGTPAGEAWREAPPPADRASWTASLRELEAEGVAGVVVPWDPRLVDLLRNPDADEDRSDLLMSTG